MRALARKLFFWVVLLGSVFPSSLTAGQVTLSWDPNTESDISGYNVWYSSGGPYMQINVGNTTSAIIPNLTEGVTYTFYATAYNMSGVESAPSASVSYTVPVTVPVIIAPIIITQPINQTISSGSPLSLNVLVSSSVPAQYQWYFNGIPIPNATGPSFQKATAGIEDSGNYAVQVSNSAGTVTSATAVILVNAAASIALPVITLQPAGQTIAEGSSFSLAVQVSDATGVQYQWLLNGFPIANATGSNLQMVSANASNAGNYSVRVSNGAGSVLSAVAEVKVILASVVEEPVMIISPAIRALFNGAPTIFQQPSGKTISAGSPMKLWVVAAGLAPLAYQWYKDGQPIDNASNSELQLVAAQPGDAGSYTVKVSNARGSVTSRAAQVIVSGQSSSIMIPPSLATQPANQTVLEGGVLNLSVQASGAPPLAYQWYRDGSAVPNANASTLQVVSAKPSDAGSYYIVVSNVYGEAQSAVAAVTVTAAQTPAAPTIDPPSITLQPQSQTVTEGTTLVLSVQASGTWPFQYQWYRNGVPIQGATLSSLSISAAQPGDSAAYTVTIANSGGTAASAPASLQIVVPPAIINQPISQTLPAGGSLKLSVTAVGSAPMQYQWFRNMTPIPGANAPEFERGYVGADDAGSYTVTIVNAAGSVTSSPAMVNLLLAPSISQQPSSQSLTVGSPILLSVQASGSEPLAYQWYRNDAEVPNATSRDLQILAGQTSDSGIYTVKVFNSAGTVTSDGASITVASGPAIIIQPVGQTLAVGTPLLLSVQAVGSTPMRYQWSRDGAPLAGATEATFRISSVQENDAGSYTVEVSNFAGSVISAPGVIRIVAPPIILEQPASQSSALGGTLRLAVRASGSEPLKYQWIHNGQELAGATGDILQISDLQAGNAGSYAVKISNAGGTLTSALVQVTILEPSAVTAPPVVTVQPLSQSLAVGSSLALSVQATGFPALQYQWFRQGVAIENATSPTLQLAFVRPEDAGSYVVRVSNAAGSVESQAADVTVFGPPTILMQPQSQTVAVGSSVVLSVQVSGSGPWQWQWFREGTSIPGATATELHIGLIEAGSAGSYSVKVSNAAGTVTSSAALISVVSAPTITRQPASQTVAIGAAVTLAVEASGSGPLEFQWFRNGNVIENATLSTLQIPSLQSSDTGAYRVRVSNGAGTVTSAPANVGLLGAPVITIQPTGMTLDAGTSLTLAVQASGAGPLQYQWYRDGMPLQSAISSVFRINASRSSDSGAYTVEVSNSVGAVTSRPANVTILSAPAILSQPQGQTLSAGWPLSLAVEVSGSNPMQFQWFRDGAPIPNANTSELRIPEAQTGDAGRYTVRVSNRIGSATSASALVTVTPETKRSVSVELEPGSGLVLRSAGPPGRTYRIEGANEIPAKEWSVIVRVTASANGVVEFTSDDPLQAKAKFYRVIAE